MQKFLFFVVLALFFWMCSAEKKTEKKQSSNPDPELEILTDQETKNNNSLPKSSNAVATDTDNIIDFYFTPSVDEKIVRERGQQLLDFLEKETKLTFKIHIPKNYAEMVEDFGNGKADVGIINSQSYVIAYEKYGVNARLRAVRYGRSTYFGQIIANKDKGINSLTDIQGKTIAYTDHSSTSGFLFPQKILKDAGVKPGKTVFAGKHDTVVKMVYEGVADAGATFYSEPAADGTIRDARARLIDKYPDIAEKVQIITITEPIPNDPVVFSKKLSDEISYEISLGLIKFISTDRGKEVMMAMYSTEGFVRCSDSDYDDLREALQE